MTNEEKLEYIKANYKSARCWKLLPLEEKDVFYERWIQGILETAKLKLYKYRQCNDINLSALKNRKAWFSNPSKWNDPLDATVKYNIEKDIKILDDNFDDYVLKFAFSFINKYIESFCEQKKFVTPEEVKKVYYSAFKGSETLDPNRMISYLTPVVGEKPAMQITAKTQEIFYHAMTSEFKKNIIDQFEKFLGLNSAKNQCIMYSLSETFSNNHQWAIYADGGKGFCIGYNIEPKNKREISLLPELLPIYYGKRKELLVSRMLEESLECYIRPETIQDLLNQESENMFVSMHTKTEEWIGEQEWRFSIPIQNPKGELIDFDFAVSLYLGENISDDWKKKLLAIAKEQKLSVYQRKMNKFQSDWIYEKIEL